MVISAIVHLSAPMTLLLLLNGSRLSLEPLSKGVLQLGHDIGQGHRSEPGASCVVVEREPYSTRLPRFSMLAPTTA
jgi:hypothetical protein